MNTERDGSSPEKIIDFVNDSPTSDWINKVSSILGTPEYQLTSEGDSDSLQEIATYYIQSSGVEDAVYPIITGTVLTVARTLSRDFPYLQLDVRTYENGEIDTKYEYFDISSINFNEENGLVSFNRALPSEDESSKVSVSVQGEVLVA